MKVIAPTEPGVCADTIPVGGCFILNGVVCMRMGGLPIAQGHLHAVILSTGQYDTLSAKRRVTPVNMTAVESNV